MKFLKKREHQNEDTISRVDEIVKNILEDIAQNKDSAVRKYSMQFDKWNPESFRVRQDEIERAFRLLPETFKEDTRYVQEQVRTFAKAQLESIKEFEIETERGILLGQKLIPVESVGCYVPGGRYPLIASATMSIVTPKVAGVSRVVATTPHSKETEDFSIHPKILFTMVEAGADEIYSIGGVQAIGAMALGTESIRPVDMIVGPGNAYVAEAKRQLFGKVGIDQISGPTEILVIADDTADPVIVAADLLGQAEHDPNSRAILITTSVELGQAVLQEVERQLTELATANIAGVSWRRNGEIIVAENDEEAAEISDIYAIEHVEVQTKNNDWYFHRLKNYGTLFVGEESTVVYSDKAIGTNHILPTGGAARYTGGLWVGKFIKVLTYQKLTIEGSLKIAPISSRQAMAEGMVGHAITADLRVKKYSQ